ncbi:MAG: efflux RND transporter periplasmic adaptor subunit [Gammaproteobacteria bacterium]|nr:efflux RND transporter periplasmic adaptor subunit [Gammaproteobacteria bacterium]
MADQAPEQPSGRRTNPRSWIARHWGKVTVATVVVLAITWLAWPEPPAPPPTPTTVAVTRGDIESTVAASGALEAASRVDVGAQVSGQLKTLHVKLGDVVAEGDLLAEIDDFIQKTRVASAVANLQSLEANTASVKASLGLARGDLARQERMMEAQATTEVDYDSAVVRLTQAEANLEQHLLGIQQARANLEEAEALLNFTRITAPANGTIVEILVQEGQTLNATQTTPVILRIGDLSKIRVVAKIPEADVGRLQPGMAAYFTSLSSHERQWETHLQEISPLPTRNSTQGGMAEFDALLLVDNSDGALLPGMTVKVFFLSNAARDVLKVPLGALSFTAGAGATSAAAQFAQRTAEVPGVPPSRSTSAPQAPRHGPPKRPDAGGDLRDAMVHVVGNGAEIEARAVRVGFDNGIEAAVVSGLAEGELVVGGIEQPPMPDEQFGRSVFFGF